MTILDRHYEALNSLQSSEKIAHWSTVPEFNDDPEKLAASIHQAKYQRKVNKLKEDATTEHGRMMKDAFVTPEDEFRRDEYMPEDHEMIAIPREMVSDLKEMVAAWKASR